MMTKHKSGVVRGLVRESEACAVCDGRVSLETFLGDEACFFGWPMLVNRETTSKLTRRSD